MKLWGVLAFLVLLLPSAWLAWEYRDMPALGWPHDDGLYFAGAKSIAEGHGHSIPSLPGAPAQTKYPPLFPMLLSIVWWISPQFPQNLKWATLLSWLLLPPMLYLCLRLYRMLGLPAWAGWLLVALLAIHPYVTLFGRTLRSETLFTVLLLGVMLAAPRWAWLAGILAGLAYLTRTAGLPLLVALPAVYAWKREWRRAAVFIAAMLPFVIGWAVWQRQNKPLGDDPYLLYYLDYVWYEFYNVGWRNLPTVLFKNFDGTFSGIAVPVLPLVLSPLDKILAQTFAIGIVIGVFRLAKEREEARPYALYAALSTIMLLVWHVPPNGRFLFPIFPLLLAGFFVIARQTANIVQVAYRDPRQKRAAIVCSAILACVGGYTIWNHAVLAAEIAPEGTRNDIVMTRDMMACASRIERELPRNALLLSDNDPLLYLRTGRQSMRLVVPSKHWYSDGSDGMLRESLRLTEVAKNHNLQYYLMHRSYDRDLGGKADLYNAAIDRNPTMRALFQCGQATVYEFADARNFSAKTTLP